MSKTKPYDQLSDEAANELEEALRIDFDEGESGTTAVPDEGSTGARTGTAPGERDAVSFEDFERQITETAGQLRDEEKPAVRRASAADFLKPGPHARPPDRHRRERRFGGDRHRCRPAGLGWRARARTDEPKAAVPTASAADEAAAVPTSDRPSGETGRPSGSGHWEQPRGYSAPPANDEERRTAVMAEALLTRRASRAPIWIALAVSAAWVGFTGFMASQLYGTDLAAAGAMPQDELAILVAVAFVPVLLIFAFAVMVRRSADLRLMSRSLAEVALKLAEPESIATERVMSVGQAIRREVAALGEGVERALSRTADLENLVHNEVSSLERAYADNEVKIRTLVQDLGSEREAMLSHAERLRSAVVGSHQRLVEDVDSASERILSRIEDASSRFGTLFEGHSDSLLKLFDEQSQAASQRVIANTEGLIGRLRETGNEVANLLEDRTETMQQRSQAMAEDLSRIGDDVTARLVASGDAVTGLLKARAENLAGDSEKFLADLTGLLDDRALGISVEGQTFLANLDTAFSERLQEIGEKDGIFLQALTDSVDTRRRRLDEDSARFLETIEHGLGDRVERASQVLSDANTRTLGDLDDRIATIDRTLAERGGALVATIEQRSTAIGESTDRATETIESRSQELTRALAERTEEIVAAFRSGHEAISVKASDAIALAHSTLDGRAEEFRSLFDQRVSGLDVDARRQDPADGQHARRAAPGLRSRQRPAHRGDLGALAKPRADDRGNGGAAGRACSTSAARRSRRASPAAPKASAARSTSACRPCSERSPSTATISTHRSALPSRACSVTSTSAAPPSPAPSRRRSSGWRS